MPRFEQNPQAERISGGTKGAYASIEQMLAFRHQAKDLTFFPRIMAKSPLAGNHRSKLRGRGMDFDEVRPYQAGDDIRTIDWRVTARTTVTHTKLFREERERPTLIVCDLRSPMFFGSRQLKSVVACEIAAALSWAGLAANERVGGMIFCPQGQQDIRSKRSHHTVLQLINALEASSKSLIPHFQQQQSNQAVSTSLGDISLVEITKDMRRVVHPGSSIFVISDFHDIDKDCEANLYKISRHSDLTLIQVYDDLECQLPPPGNYPVYDGQHRFILNSGNQEFRQRFEQQFNQRQLQLRQLADRLQSPLLKVKTSTAIMPFLHQAYGRKKRLPR